MPRKQPAQRNSLEPQTPRVLPDPKICRTTPIGDIRLFGTCLVNNPIECAQAFNFGDGYICRHPNWKDFIKPNPPADEANGNSRANRKR